MIDSTISHRANLLLSLHHSAERIGDADRGDLTGGVETSVRVHEGLRRHRVRLGLRDGVAVRGVAVRTWPGPARPGNQTIGTPAAVKTTTITSANNLKY